jgi:hypothetical protein
LSIRAFSKWRMTCAPVCSSFCLKCGVDGLEHALAQHFLVDALVFLQPLADRQVDAELAFQRLFQPGTSHCSSMLPGGM